MYCIHVIIMSKVSNNGVRERERERKRKRYVEKNANRHNSHK